MPLYGGVKGPCSHCFIIGGGEGNNRGTKSEEKDSHDASGVGGPNLLGGGSCGATSDGGEGEGVTLDKQRPQ